MSALRELVAFFGVEVDTKQIDAADKKIEGFKSTLEQAAAALGVAFSVRELGEFVKGQVEMGAELLHTSEILGLSIGDLQAFQYAAANAGLGADEANTALRFLNKNLGEAASKGGDAAEAFQKLGVKIKDSNGHTRATQDIFADVADGIRKLPSPAEKTAKAMELFGRAGARMIPLLNKGSKGIDEFYKEFEKLGGGIDEEFVQAAEEGEHQLNKLNLAMKGAKATIASALLPAFSWVVDKVTDTVSWMRELTKHSYIVQTTMAVLAGIVGVMALIWAAMNIEVILAVVALALLVLIVDDIYTAFMGGKSVVGDFIDSLFGVGATAAIVATVKDAARELWTQLGDLWTATKDFVGALLSLAGQSGSTTASLSSVLGVIKAIAHEIGETVQKITEFEKGLTKLAGKYEQFKKDHPQIASAMGTVAEGATTLPVGAKALKKGATAVINPVGVVKDIGAELIGLASQAGGGDAPQHAATHADIAYSSGRNDAGDTTRNTTINVEVKGGHTNGETGRVVGAAVEDAARKAENQASYAAAPGAGGS